MTTKIPDMTFAGLQQKRRSKRDYVYKLSIVWFSYISQRTVISVLRFSDFTSRGIILFVSCY